MTFEITSAVVSDKQVADLIERHFALMRSQSPAESCHVLPASDLANDDVTLLAVREGGTVLAIGGLRIQEREGELKSMHTAAEARGRGLARALLNALIDEARSLGVTRLSLETGSSDAFIASRALYASMGFEECPPFGAYKVDPLSVFMTRAI